MLSFVFGRSRYVCPATGVSTEGGCLGTRGLGPQSLCDGADLGIAMVLHCPLVIVTVVVIIITIIRIIAIARVPGLEMVMVIDGNKLVVELASLASS